jgi:hypothetical protein
VGQAEDLDLCVLGGIKTAGLAALTDMDLSMVLNQIITIGHPRSVDLDMPLWAPSADKVVQALGRIEIPSATVLVGTTHEQVRGAHLLCPCAHRPIKPRYSPAKSAAAEDEP